MSQSEEHGGAIPQIGPEQIKLRADDDGPVLDVAGTEIHLKVGHYGDGDVFESDADDVSTEVDSNGDFAWWIVYPDDLSHQYIEIWPEVVGDG